MTQSNYKQLLFGSLLILALSGCYPEGPESASDYNIIASAYDEGYLFSLSQTYILPDTIIFHKDDDQNNDINLTDEQRKIFVNTARDNLDLFGWEDRTEIDTTADVLVFVSVISSKFSGNIWEDWFNYHGWGTYEPMDPDGKYSWIPGYSSFLYDYNVGSLIMSMIDVAELENQPEDPPVVWMGGVNGLLNSKLTVQTEPVVEAIDKVFELAQILDKN